jgi:hypothetical protein
MQFTCPHCDKIQIVTRPKHRNSFYHIDIQDLADGNIGIVWNAVGCANSDCRKITIDIQVRDFVHNSASGRFIPDRDIRPAFEKRIVPFGSTRQLPDYIPEPLREDYIEACQIRELSPKAAATLIRRCLQGMIRDFCGISGKTLFLEISELKRRVQGGTGPKGVSEESVDAIDHVRGIGNIGAHMEHDINNVIPVDPNEAKLLIELAETLFDEWYVSRHKREERFSSIKRLADSKDEHKRLLSGNTSED